MVVAVGVSPWLVSSWRMSHFGKKPVRGGSPASESKVSMRAVFSVGAFVHIIIIICKFRVLVVFRVRNTAAVNIVYR